MDRQRVCIVGGGVAGLTAAYELSKDAEARARFDVEVVEMGHRLGGRLASAHNRSAWGRNQEHGLHVWFGFYANTFRMAEQVWDHLERPEGCPWESVYDGLRGVGWSDHGFVDDGTFVVRRAFHGPGLIDPDDDSLVALNKVVRGIVGHIAASARTWGSTRRGAADRGVGSRFERLLGVLGRPLTALDPAATPADRLRAGARLERFVRAVHPRLVRAVRKVAGPSPDLDELAQLIDLSLSMLRGVLSIEHRILQDGDFDRISAWEFTDWLRHHGLADETVAGSQILRAVYDVPFAYRDGDRDQPVVEAATALRYLLRIQFGHGGDIAYLLQAGAGETLIAPLMHLLRERGVRFRFFHRLDAVQVDDTRLIALDFTRVARTRGTYDPLVVRNGMHAFRDTPDFDQLVGGAALCDRGVDFYSRFGDRGETDRVRISVDEDFDQVILALPLGCIAEDGDGHSPVRGWLDAHPPARACIERLHLVPTVAAQLWLDDPPEAYDFVDRAIVTWAAPYSVLCDMSPVIALEDWGPAGPRSSAYLCGAWPLDGHRAPSSDREAPARAQAEAVRTLIVQLEDHGGSVFGGGSLHQPEGAADPLEAQYIRANIEPWDLADLPLPGANTVRLEAVDTGLRNLAVAGSWVRTPVNTTSVEAAVTSGIAAARALGARTQPIIGEALFRRPSRHLLLPELDHDRHPTSPPVREDRPAGGPRRGARHPAPGQPVAPRVG